MMLFLVYLVLYFVSAFSANQEDEDSLYGRVDDICGQPYIEPLVENSKVQARIVSGYKAKAHSWPWQVSIRGIDKKKKTHHVCGGTIIAPNKILSAAHCLFSEYGKKEKNYQVAVGKHDRSINEMEARVYRIKNISVPSSFNWNTNKYPDDIMVMTLTEDMKYDNNIMPICLAQSNEPRDKVCYVTGWGNSKYSSSEAKFSNVLKQIDIPIRNVSACLKVDFGLKVRFNAKKMICAGGKAGKDACQGDSGGPLVCKENGIWYQYGIISMGKSCARKNIPGIYTRVYYYRNWLDEQINGK